jgi:hypothetical protein
MTNEEKVWILTNMRYDAGTGTLERWLKSGTWRACSGKAVSNGYAMVKVLGEPMGAHRVSWLLAHGSIDDGLCIDHINGVRNDNRLCNLRLDTHRKNDQNKECHREGKLVGACWNKECKKWQAYININGRQKHLGLFSTEQEAHEAYNQAVKALAN